MSDYKRLIVYKKYRCFKKTPDYACDQV